jgi:hypothetical protein
MTILERWITPYPFTARDKVSDHAAHRLCPSCVRLNLVPVSSLYADGTHRLAASSRGL